MKNHKTNIQIVADAPEGAVTYCMYDYGDEMTGLYLNCENQFFCEDDQKWVDMSLVDNYFHRHRRLADICNIIGLTNRISGMM